MTISNPPLAAPTANRRTEAFLAGVNRDEFLLNECEACKTLNAPEAEQCAACHARGFAAVPASLNARLVSWVVTHQRAATGGTEIQGILVIGELDEGPWWWGALTDATSPDELEPGMRLKINFATPEGSEQKIPVFLLRQS